MILNPPRFGFLPPKNLLHEWVMREEFCTIDGSDNCSAVIDRIGGLNLASVAADPLLITAGDAGINGHQCLETDGTEYLQSALSALSQPFTIVAVVLDGDVDDPVNATSLGSAGSNGARFQWRSADNVYRMKSSTDVDAGTDSREVNWHRVVGIFDSPSCVLRVNGSSIATGDSGSDGLDGLSLFANAAGGQMVSSGTRCSHIGVYGVNTDDAGLTPSIEAFLALEYGL